MTDKPDIIQDDLVFKAGTIAESMGLSKSMGQLYAALYFSKDATSLDELAKKCKMSKGNASINIRRLERWDAVKKVWGNTNRKDYYVANKDILSFALNHGLKVFLEILDKGERALADVKTKIEQIEDSKPKQSDSENTINYKKSIKELEALAKKLKALTGNFKLVKTLLHK